MPSTAVARKAAFIRFPGFSPIFFFSEAERINDPPSDTGQFQFTKLLRFPNSWGENKNGTQTPLPLDALRKRMCTCHQNTGIEPNKYFYIQQIRCQAGQTAGAA